MAGAGVHTTQLVVVVLLLLLIAFGAVSRRRWRCRRPPREPGAPRNGRADTLRRSAPFG